MENEVKPVQCPDANGTLPACAPLAVPYVPFQQPNPQKYDQQMALNHGTLFPGLDLPFRSKAEPANAVQNALNELQALEFVILELGLYLDTHQSDAEAFTLFQQYVSMEEQARMSYTAMYGPIFQREAANNKTYSWIKDPWPWNYVEGAAR